MKNSIQTILFLCLMQFSPFSQGFYDEFYCKNKNDILLISYFALFAAALYAVLGKSISKIYKSKAVNQEMKSGATDAQALAEGEKVFLNTEEARKFFILILGLAGFISLGLNKGAFVCNE